MRFWKQLLSWWKTRFKQPAHLLVGQKGEHLAKKHLQSLGMHFLTANFRSDHGEIDLVFRDGQCLIFVEVKTRSTEGWTRPAAAVNQRKRRLLTQTALDYLRLIQHPPITIRFDVVEVIFPAQGEVIIRHLPNAFAMTHPYSYRPGNKPRKK